MGVRGKGSMALSFLKKISSLVHSYNSPP